MTSPNSTQTGYSLIEVLVAFVILSLTLGIMFRVFSAGLRNIDTAADYTEAVVIAESRLATPGVIEPLVMGQQQGTAAERYSWIRTISPFDSRDRGQLSDPAVMAYRIDVSVQWSKFGAERKVQLSTIRLENKAARK
jgi:general secretion pathway protein I